MRWLMLSALVMGCTPTAEIVERRDLSSEVGEVARALTGITVVGDSLVLSDSEAGLIRLDDAGASVLLSANELGGEPTDVVALGAGQFAVTLPGIGVRVDFRANTVEPYFCYEPGWMEPQESQLTESVALDPVSGQLVAQPQTRVGRRPVRTDLAWFDATTGTDLEWRPLTNPRFLADALAVDTAGDFWLGVANLVYTVERAGDRAQPALSLPADEGDIVGMTFHDGELMVLTDRGVLLTLQ